MSRSRCTVCRKSHPDGTAGVYSAGYFDSGLRIAYKNFMCPECIQSNLMPLLNSTPLERAIEDDSNCAVCGTDTSGDAYFMYFNVFPPSGTRSDHEVLLCLKCQADVQRWISDGGKRLPNREPIENSRVRTPEAWAFLAG